MQEATAEASAEASVAAAGQTQAYESTLYASCFLPGPASSGGVPYLCTVSDFGRLTLCHTGDEAAGGPTGGDEADHVAGAADAGKRYAVVAAASAWRSALLSVCLMPREEGAGEAVLCAGAVGGAVLVWRLGELMQEMLGEGGEEEEKEEEREEGVGKMVLETGAEVSCGGGGACGGKADPGAVWQLAQAEVDAPTVAGRSLPCDCNALCAPMHGEATLVVGGGDGLVYALDVETGKVLRALPGHRNFVHQVRACSAVPGLVASASEDGTVRTWDLRANSRHGSVKCYEDFPTTFNRRNRSYWAGALDFDATGQFLLCGGGSEGKSMLSATGWVASLHASSGAVIAAREAPCPVQEILCFGEESNPLVGRSDGMVAVYDGAMLSPQSELVVSPSSVFSISAASPSGPIAVAGSSPIVDILHSPTARAYSIWTVADAVR